MLGQVLTRPCPVRPGHRARPWPGARLRGPQGSVLPEGHEGASLQ